MIRSKRSSYIVVVGERELESGKITVRHRKNEQKEMTVPGIMDAIGKEIREVSRPGYLSWIILVSSGSVAVLAPGYFISLR